MLLDSYNLPEQPGIFAAQNVLLIGMFSLSVTVVSEDL